ncbi:ribosome-inactivating family protein [Streptomyces sp. ME02-8801-2C]|uniref:ribosome-inactivating family protein n=1 Tax=Streptomyces sp. ME02-8801-2C TaxID=3028680 RepID=UPI0029B146BB|nr:ribosome-inactivating family protein [Streptomyces sp. ME02-8801-2C]MDX3452620.1 ribosome-inactivating family protein [Streptomyces sp. ME02-8801-2C]
MPTSVLITVALSVLLGFLVMALPTGGTETVAGRKRVNFPQVCWDINRGSDTYLTMLDQLRNLAETSTDGRGFADIVISSGNTVPTLHATVRLSDFRVVRFVSSDTPHDFALNLVSDVPDKEDVTDDNWFLGKQGYDALARVANQSLTAVDLSGSGLEESLRDLGVRGTDRTAQARGMLRFVIAITEASRFRPIAHHIMTGMDSGSDLFLTAQQVGLMRP